MQTKTYPALGLRAAITNYHKLGDLDNRNYFLTVLEAGNSEIKVLADSMSQESQFPGS